MGTPERVCVCLNNMPSQTMLAGERLTACPTPPLTIKLHTSPSPNTLHISHSQPLPSLQHSFHGIPSLQKHSLWNLRACAGFRVSSGPRVSANFKVSSSTSGSDKPRDNGFPRKKLAVFVSGGGSNFQTLHQASLKNKIYGDVVVVVSDKPACKACDYAKSNNISVVEYPKSAIAHAGLSPTELVATLRQYEIDFVLLAGFLKLLPGELIQAYPQAILNIHPALLPAFGGKGFYGRKVHEAVIKSGARYSGPTIHFVDEKYDHGVILAQRVVPVLPYDTADDLAARVLKEEHSLYPEVVAAICEDRIFWREDGVPLIRRSWDEAEYY